MIIMFSTDLFCVPKHYEDSIANIMITHGTIQDRIEKLAKDIFYDVFNEVSYN